MKHQFIPFVSIPLLFLSPAASADFLLDPQENGLFPGTGATGRALCDDIDGTGREDYLVLRGGSVYVAHEPSVYKNITNATTDGTTSITANDFDTLRAVGSQPASLFLASDAGVYESTWDWSTVSWSQSAVAGAPGAKLVRVVTYNGHRALFGIDLNGDSFALEEVSGAWQVISGAPSISNSVDALDLLPCRVGGGTAIDTLGVVMPTEFRMHPFSGGVTVYAASGWTYQGGAVIGTTVSNSEYVAVLATYASTLPFVSVIGSTVLGTMAAPAGVTSIASGHFSDPAYDDLVMFAPATGPALGAVFVWQDILEPGGLQQRSVELLETVSATSSAVPALGDLDGDTDGDLVVALDSAGGGLANIQVNVNSPMATNPGFEPEYYLDYESDILTISPSEDYTGIAPALAPNRMELLVFEKVNGEVLPDPVGGSGWYALDGGPIGVSLGFNPAFVGEITRYITARYIQIDETTGEVLVGHEPVTLMYHADPEGLMCFILQDMGFTPCLEPQGGRIDVVGESKGGVPGHTDPPPPFDPGG